MITQSLYGVALYQHRYLGTEARANYGTRYVDVSDLCNLKAGKIVS